MARKQLGAAPSNTVDTATKAYVDAAIASAKLALFPVGSYYINETDNTNPGTLLGFGTWAAIAQSRMLIGAGTGTFVSTFANTAITTGTDIITVTSNDSLHTGAAAVLTTAGSLTGTGLTASTTYYIIRVTATTIKLATSVANAVAGTAIDLTGQGTGNHTLTITYTARTASAVGGEETHAQVIAEMPSHTHTQNSHNHTQDAHAHGFLGVNGASMGNGSSYPGLSDNTNRNPSTQNATATNQAATATNQNTGGSSGSNIMNPYVVVYVWKRTA